jgi:hypothetical protein
LAAFTVLLKRALRQRIDNENGTAGQERAETVTLVA